MKPKVRYVGELQDMGAGHPDLEIALTACLGTPRTGRGRHARPGPRHRAPTHRTRTSRPAIRRSGLERNPVPVPRDTGDDAHTPSDPNHTPGDITFDIYLNDRAYWRNVPATVWNYKLGGYQVLKKWLSYREHKVLHRPPSTGED